MKLATLALSSIVALLVSASIALATAAIPIPAKKPGFVPWWLGASIAAGQCSPTKSAMATLAERGVEPLYWAPLSSINSVRLVGQIWGTPNGEMWMVVAHFSTGMSCLISMGVRIPEWATEIDGIRS